MKLFLLPLLFGLHVWFLHNSQLQDKVVFMDIGIGDSALINVGERNILIDGGPDDLLIYKLGKYMKITVFDVLIITHPHADHYSGVLDIVERYRVKEVWVPHMCDKSLILQLKSVNPDLNIIEIEKMMVVGLGENSYIQVLHPEVIGKECISARSGKELNNASIVVKLIGSRNILFMGDLEHESEQKLVDRFGGSGVLRSEVLKSGHHCSKSSSTEAFLMEVMPDIAVCSTGASNKYGHPSPEVLDRYAKLGIESLVTFEEGDILIELN